MREKNEKKKKLCIYHGNCADGFSAAVVTLCALGMENVDFHAGFFGHEPPDVTDRTVYIVDFSYPREVMIEMAKTAERIVVLDHHKTAEKHLVDLPDNIETHFDMNRSGAIMAWDYFYPDQDPPRVLLHVQDRDLWRFELDHTREIQSALFSYPYELDLWYRLVMTDEYIEDLIRDGKAINRKHMKDVDELIAVAGHSLTLCGYKIPALNAPYFYSSEAGSELAKDAPFAACYYIKANEVYISLRSSPKGVDVSEIAETFGGGGHRAAAAFRVSRDQFMDMLL